MGRLSLPTLHLGYHYKTFSSTEQYKMVLKSVNNLDESSFYFNAITGNEATALLANEPIGTFLVRDSSHQQYLFTLTIKTVSGIRNVRILCDEKSFYLYTDPKNVEYVPHFDCVLKLINHYMPQGSGTNIYIYAKGERTPLKLIKPLYSTMSSLKHLCRRQINRKEGVHSDKVQLPNSLQEYLFEYEESF